MYPYLSLSQRNNFAAGTERKGSSKLPRNFRLQLDPQAATCELHPQPSTTAYARPSSENQCYSVGTFVGRWDRDPARTCGPAFHPLLPLAAISPRRAPRNSGPSLTRSPWLPYNRALRSTGG